MSIKDYEQSKENVIQTISLGRMGNSDEVAKATLSLVSDDVAVTLLIWNFFVDGGVRQI
jgi:hypothetical protein